MSTLKPLERGNANDDEGWRFLLMFILSAKLFCHFVPSLMCHFFRVMMLRFLRCNITPGVRDAQRHRQHAECADHVHAGLLGRSWCIFNWRYMRKRRGGFDCERRLRLGYRNHGCLGRGLSSVVLHADPQDCKRGLQRKRTRQVIYFHCLHCERVLVLHAYDMKKNPDVSVQHDTHRCSQCMLRNLPVEASCLVNRHVTGQQVLLSKVHMISPPFPSIWKICSN